MPVMMEKQTGARVAELQRTRLAGFSGEISTLNRRCTRHEPTSLAALHTLVPLHTALLNSALILLIVCQTYSRQPCSDTLWTRSRCDAQCESQS